MSCDKLVYDLSQEVEGAPNVFVRKDWINILDNQNQNYQNNQSIIDTSQLSNSNKYMSYREAYLSVPMLLSMSTPLGVVDNVGANPIQLNDYSIGLKNWFGSIIHSLTLDYNGTTIIQQTPFCSMWNIFKLMTSLSYNDLKTQGCTIGFYPDTSGSWAYWNEVSGNGYSVCNNDMGLIETITQNVTTNNYTQFNGGGGGGGNAGLTYRTKWIAYNPNAGILTSSAVPSLSYTNIGPTAANCGQIWKSYISYKRPISNGQYGLIQYSIMGTIYLKHLHSFFNMCPLLKGVFMKITMNLNNASSQLTVDGLGTDNPLFTGYTSNVNVGGCLPLIIPCSQNGSNYMQGAPFEGAVGTFTYELTVGSTSLNASITQAQAGVAVGAVGAFGGQLSKSIYLYVPAYTFNPSFETAYLSNNIKQIKYTDIYQYQVQNVQNQSQFNNLITNGIANIKSVLIIPFLANNPTTVPPTPYAEYQSPFDTAGCGTTAPMVTLGNFNVQISGQNAIYNTQRYTFEEWNNQLYGQNAVNGGLTDGLTSGLIDFSDFQNAYCYYYVNVERMLPVEQSVPKSVQIIGQNYSQVVINLWVFIEYGVEVHIDVLTGARV